MLVSEGLVLGSIDYMNNEKEMEDGEGQREIGSRGGGCGSALFVCVEWRQYGGP